MTGDEDGEASSNGGAGAKVGSEEAPDSVTEVLNWSASSWSALEYRDENEGGRGEGGLGEEGPDGKGLGGGGGLLRELLLSTVVRVG